MSRTKTIALADAITAYGEFLRGTGHAFATIQSVTCCLRSFDHNASGGNLAESIPSLMPFLSKRADELCRNSQSTYFNFMRCFFAFCVRQGWVSANPLDGIRAPKPEKKVTLPLSDREILTLYASADHWGRAMLVLLLGSGMRIGELSGLRWADVGEDQLTVKGKGSKERTLAPGQRAMAMIQALPRTGETVFPFTRMGTRDRMAKLSRRAGVPFHAHQMRHTFAHRFLEDGGNIEELSEILGHENLNTTLVYLRAFRRERALDAQRAHNPADALFRSGGSGGNGGGGKVIAIGRPRAAAGAR